MASGCAQLTLRWSIVTADDASRSIELAREILSALGFPEPTECRGPKQMREFIERSEQLVRTRAVDLWSLARMSNVLDEEQQQQILALGRLGWSLRRIEAATGVRRETIGGYLRAAGIGVRGRGRPGERAAKAAISPEVSTEARVQRANFVFTVATVSVVWFTSTSLRRD